MPGPVHPPGLAGTRPALGGRHENVSTLNSFTIGRDPGRYVITKAAWLASVFLSSRRKTLRFVFVMEDGTQPSQRLQEVTELRGATQRPRWSSGHILAISAEEAFRGGPQPSLFFRGSGCLTWDMRDRKSPARDCVSAPGRDVALQTPVHGQQDPELPQGSRGTAAWFLESLLASHRARRVTS